MSVIRLKTRSAALNLWTQPKCCYSSKVEKILKNMQVDEVPIYEEEEKCSIVNLEQLQNKSRLNPEHRRILHNQAPYDEPIANYHDRVWYRRKMLGKYGMNAPLVNPQWCWPTKEEIEDTKEYERVLYPVSLQDLWEQIEEKKKQDAINIKQREEEIDKVVANFDKWRASLKAKIIKKEAAILEAKMKKEMLMEEIQEQFGFKINPKDERYQEILAAKEKEDKKKKKEAQKKLKLEKFLSDLSKQEEASANIQNENQINKVVSKNENTTSEKEKILSNVEIKTNDTDDTSTKQ